MNKIFGIAAIAILWLATWLTVSHHPITERINVWQAGIMGNNKFFPALTIFGLGLPPLLLFHGIKFVVLKRIKR